MGDATVPHSAQSHPPRRGLLGLAPHCLDSSRAWGCRRRGVQSQEPEEPFLLTSHVDQRRTRGLPTVGTESWNRNLAQKNHAARESSMVHAWFNRARSSVAGKASKSNMSLRELFFQFIL